MDPKGKGKLNESASNTDLNSEGKPVVRKLKITRVFKNEIGGEQCQWKFFESWYCFLLSFSYF